METSKVIKALYRLINCPDLGLENLEEETLEALAQAQGVVGEYWKEIGNIEWRTEIAA